MCPPNPPNRHTYAFFVQPWQNLSKLNYVAICWVFDVINLKPCWNVHRLEGLWATINAVMLYECTPLKSWKQKDETVARGLFCIKCFVQSLGASWLGPIIPLWLQKWWLFRSREGCWLVVTSGKGQWNEGWEAVCVLWMWGRGIFLIMRGWNA